MVGSSYRPAAGQCVSRSTLEGLEVRRLLSDLGCPLTVTTEADCPPFGLSSTSVKGSGTPPGVGVGNGAPGREL